MDMTFCTSTPVLACCVETRWCRHASPVEWIGHGLLPCSCAGVLHGTTDDAAGSCDGPHRLQAGYSRLLQWSAPSLQWSVAYPQVFKLAPSPSSKWRVEYAIRPYYRDTCSPSFFRVVLQRRKRSKNGTLVCKTFLLAVKSILCRGFEVPLETLCQHKCLIKLQKIIYVYRDTHIHNRVTSVTRKVMHISSTIS